MFKRTTSRWMPAQSHHLDRILRVPLIFKALFARFFDNACRRIRGRLIASPRLSSPRSPPTGSNGPCRQARIPTRVAFCCPVVALSLIAGATASIAQAAEGCDALGLSQTDVNECYANAYKRVDAELNVLYQQITARLKDDKATTKLLVAAQRRGWRSATPSAIFRRPGFPAVAPMG